MGSEHPIIRDRDSGFDADSHGPWRAYSFEFAILKSHLPARMVQGKIHDLAIVDLCLEREERIRRRYTTERDRG